MFSYAISLSPSMSAWVTARSTGRWICVSARDSMSSTFASSYTFSVAYSPAALSARTPVPDYPYRPSISTSARCPRVRKAHCVDVDSSLPSLLFLLLQPAQNRLCCFQVINIRLQIHLQYSVTGDQEQNQERTVEIT